MTDVEIPLDESPVGDLADELALTVLAVDGVARLHTGLLDEIGTYLPGRRVGGVRLRGEVLTGEGSVEVHVVLTDGVPVREAARSVHAAVAAALSRRGLNVPVLVHVDDVEARAADPTHRTTV